MTIKSLENLGKAWLEVVKAYKDLFFLELALARRSFIPFLLVTLLLTAALSAFVITSLAVISYFVYLYTHNWLVALLLAELDSILSVMLVFFFLRRYFNQLKFNYFRTQLKKEPKQQGTQNESDKIT